MTIRSATTDHRALVRRAAPMIARAIHELAAEDVSRRDITHALFADVLLSRAIV